MTDISIYRLADALNDLEDAGGDVEIAGSWSGHPRAVFKLDGLEVHRRSDTDFHWIVAESEEVVSE